MADLSDFKDFDPTTHTPEPREKKEFGLIPDGTYTAVVVGSDVRDTQAGTGKFTELTFQIIDGPQQNRMIWQKFNLINPNPKAVRISRDHWGGFLAAVGVSNPQNTDETHNIPLQIRIGHGLNKSKGKDENKIYEYSKAGTTGSDSGEQGNSNAVPQNTAQQPVGGALPWQRSK